MEVEEVVTYYSMLHKKPHGKHHIQICTNISCLLTGGAELWEHARQKLGIGHKEVTPDGQFSLEEVECIGACSWAPAIQVNYDFHHKVTPEKLDRLIESLQKLHMTGMLYNEPSPLEVKVLTRRFGLAEFRVHRHLPGDRRL